MRLETCGPDSSPRAAPRPPRAGTGGPGRRGLPILPPPSCLPPPAPRAAPSRAEPAAGGRARSDTRRLPEYAVGQRQSMQRKNAISSSALERLETGWRGGEGAAGERGNMFLENVLAGTSPGLEQLLVTLVSALSNSRIPLMTS